MLERSDKKFEITVINILEVLMEKIDKMEVKNNFIIIETRKTVKEIKNAFDVLIYTGDRPEEFICGFEDR